MGRPKGSTNKPSEESGQAEGVGTPEVGTPEKVTVIKAAPIADNVLLVYSKTDKGVIQGGLPAFLRLECEGSWFELKPGEAVELPRSGALRIKDSQAKWDKSSITQNVTLEIRELAGKR